MAMSKLTTLKDQTHLKKLKKKKKNQTLEKMLPTYTDSPNN